MRTSKRKKWNTEHNSLVEWLDKGRCSKNSGFQHASPEHSEGAVDKDLAHSCSKSHTVAVSLCERKVEVVRVILAAQKAEIRRIKV
jgi:hypothetical protein